MGPSNVKANPSSQLNENHANSSQMILSSMPTMIEVPQLCSLASADRHETSVGDKLDVSGAQWVLSQHQR